MHHLRLRLRSLLSLLLLLTVSSTSAGAASAATCNSRSQPNPINTLYPNDPTGTINGTASILPVDYATARSIIPPQYPILRRPWKVLFPDWERRDIYPILLQAVQDHDVRFGDLSVIADFSRAGLTFPFVDLLGDGYSSFRYSTSMLISADNAIALEGAALYGPPDPIGATFDPPCDAYRKDGDDIAFDGFDAATGTNLVSTSFTKVPDAGVPIAVFKNLTNQPIFGNGKVCDNFVTLFNSSITEGEYAPVQVEGRVSVTPPFYPEERCWEQVRGIKVDLAFVEHNAQACASLKGYHGTGSGD